MIADETPIGPGSERS